MGANLINTQIFLILYNSTDFYCKFEMEKMFFNQDPRWYLRGIVPLPDGEIAVDFFQQEVGQQVPVSVHMVGVFLSIRGKQGAQTHCLLVRV